MWNFEKFKKKLKTKKLKQSKSIQCWQCWDRQIAEETLWWRKRIHVDFFSEVMWPNVTSVTLFFRPTRWSDRQINVDQTVTPLAFSLQLMKPRFFESQIIWARGVSWQIANGDFCTFSTAVDPTGLTYLQRHLVTRAIFKNFDSPIF